jgi:hypothetical protein
MSGVPATDARAAAEEEALGHRAGQKCHFAVQCPYRAKPDRAGAAAHTIHDAPAVNRERGRERTAQLEQDQRRLTRLARPASHLIADRERRRTHLVRRADVHAIDLAMLRHRGQVNHSGCHDNRQLRSRHGPEERAKAADATGLPRRGQVREPKIGLGEIARVEEGKPVAGWAGDEFDRPLAPESIEERLRIRERLGCGNRGIEKDLSAVQAAQVDGDGARIDADDARHA